ncbi:LANO_0G06788g1_1 [Lachancea nothofagi CBS 11611]|uniref:LANO_0G06788g1_1 n=1 Tax=Lachancea nothofagi CBS 11611 TaxID=1266666 RepID=A0A1G4KHA7_9SACH|nr:LANO_0G06788g1_1 [Lachancea nothofagi CBS 11611]
MTYNKRKANMSLSDSIVGNENSQGFLGSFDHGLKNRYSSKKSDSLFTRRDSEYKGIKDSLLLYEDQSFELGNAKAANFQRRRMSGAKDYSDTESIYDNFARGKHVWYHDNSASRSLNVPSENPTPNSFNIREVIENAAHSIANSRKACLGIKERLSKYSSPNFVRIPGSFFEDQTRKTAESNSYIDDRADSSGNEVKLKTSEPVVYLSRFLLAPVTIKIVYFLLAHCATAESKVYSFTDTCSMIVDAERSGFTLSQLDTLVLQITEIWFLIKTMPILIKIPWRLYKVTGEYRACSIIGDDIYELRNDAAFCEFIKLCKRHEGLGYRLHRTSWIILLVSPILLTLGPLLGHTLTFKLAMYNPTINARWPVYSSFMALVFSPSQFALLTWCLWCQYFKDAFEHLEKYVVNQHQTFVRETEFIADHIDQSGQTGIEDLDGGTKQSEIPKQPPISLKKTIIPDQNLEDTHPVDSPSSNIKLPSFAMAAYESPLKGKKKLETPLPTIQPVSPLANKFPHIEENFTSPRSSSYIGLVVKIPFYILSLQYRICRFGFKIGVYFLFLCYWILLGRRHISRSDVTT